MDDTVDLALEVAKYKDLAEKVSIAEGALLELDEALGEQEKVLISQGFSSYEQSSVKVKITERAGASVRESHLFTQVAQCDSVLRDKLEHKFVFKGVAATPEHDAFFSKLVEDAMALGVSVTSSSGMHHTSLASYALGLYKQIKASEPDTEAALVEFERAARQQGLAATIIKKVKLDVDGQTFKRGYSKKK